MKLKFKILGAISCGAIIAGSGVVGAIYGIKSSSSSSDKDNFKPVIYNGQLFSSHEQLVNYINDNSEQVSQTKGDSVFSVNLGNDLKEFFNYDDAHQYIMKNLHPMEVYVKPNATPDPINNTYSSNQFIEKTIFYNEDGSINHQKTKQHDDANKYYAFQRESSLGDGLNLQAGHHSYILVRANAPQSVIEEARKKAAATYVQIHSAYFFDGTYFKTKNDIKTYILLNQSHVGFEENLNSGNFYQLLLPTGTTYNYDVGNITDSSQIAQKLLSDEAFKNAVANSSTPYYTYMENGIKKYIAINDQNVLKIGQYLDESKIDYIRVAANGDRTLEIVDMDASTPNGDFFGSYFTESGMGMQQIADVGNWKRSSQSTFDQKGDLVDVSILKGTINYLLSSKGYKSPLNLLNVATIKEGGLTLFEYLKNYNKDFKNPQNGTIYLNNIVSLVKTLAKGRRYNHLDTIIAMYKRMMDGMLEHRENVQTIRMVANYFNSMAKFLDAMLQIFLAPFFGLDSKLQTDTALSNFKINYFENAFSFYDDDTKGGGIDFQKDPYSYYRKLLGLKDSQTDSYQNNRNIFHLIQTAMGLHSLSMKGLIYNQGRYDKWAKIAIDHVKKQRYLWKQKKFFNKLSFSNDELHDFTFSVKESGANQDEKDGIWNNIYQIIGSIKISGIEFDKYQLVENFETYIKDIQNPYIKKYIDRLKSQIDHVYNKYHDHYESKIINGKNQTKFFKAKKYDPDKTRQDFLVNTVGYIDIDVSDIDSGVFVTTADRMRHLHKMVESAVRPLRDRIKNFATAVGTVLAKGAIALATSGATAETTLVETSLKSSVVFKKDSFQFKNTDNYAFWTSRSTLYTSNNWSVRNIHIKKKTTTSIWDKINKASKFRKDFSTYQANNIQSTLTSSFASSIVLSEYFPDVHSFIKDVADVVLKIAENVFPPLSMLFSAINSFNSQETQTYYYNQSVDGDNFYWNGGLVNYSWWGLSADQEFSIEDLKMIESQVIVSGHPLSKSGYYYNGKYYEDLGGLKTSYADQLLDEIRTSNKYQLATNKNPFMKNINWGIHLVGLSTQLEPTDFSTLLTEVANVVAKTKIAKKLYKNANGTLTTNMGEALDSAIAAVLSKIKPVLIMQLPKIKRDVDGNVEIVVESNFTLPVPYFENGGLINTNEKSTNTRKIVINPNLHKDKDAHQTFVPGSAEEKMHLLVEQARTNLANQTYENNHDALMRLIMEYIDYLHIPVKKIIWEEASGSIQGNRHKSYEELDSEWSSSSTTIYNFKAINGEQKYYSTKKAAIEALISDANYKISHKVRGRSTVIYKFDNQLFTAINQIYDYIIKHATSGETMYGDNNLFLEEKWNR